MRAQIHRQEIRSIWLNIGLALIISDLLLIIVVAADLANIKTRVNRDLLCIPKGPKWIYIWYAFNDFVIGVYCLLAFILPLINYIKLENDMNSSSNQQSTNFNDIHIETSKHSTTVTTIAKKIIIYNSIALICTMLSTFYVMAINEKSVGMSNYHCHIQTIYI